jgi:uncharacterized protein with NRDE domain
MCLVIVDTRWADSGAITILSNRDEFYARPTAPLQKWSDKTPWFGGKDEQDGGTWLAISENGAWGLLTNYRDPSKRVDGRPSRGLIITEFLNSKETPTEFLKSFRAKAAMFNPFNVILGRYNEVVYFSSLEMDPRTLPHGLYGLSNSLLDTPWFKVQRAKELYHGLARLPAEVNSKGLFEVLKNQDRPADEALPQTGVSKEWEKILSPIFVSSTDYGTRSSSIAFLKPEGGTIFERSFDSNAKLLDSRDLKIDFVKNVRLG